MLGEEDEKDNRLECDVELQTHREQSKGVGYANTQALFLLLLLKPFPIALSYYIANKQPSSSLFSSSPELSVGTDELEPENISTKSLTPSLKKRPANMGEMKKGYYILDANETARRGIPKYIYLGPESPQLVFRSQEP
jgi:hypothetical protein